MTTPDPGPHVLRAAEGDVTGEPGLLDRYLLESAASDGLEKLFRRLGESGGEYDPETLTPIAAAYGCDLDFEGTMPLVEKHGLVF